VRARAVLLLRFSKLYCVKRLVTRGDRGAREANDQTSLSQNVFSVCPTRCCLTHCKIFVACVEFVEFQFSSALWEVITGIGIVIETLFELIEV